MTPLIPVAFGVVVLGALVVAIMNLVRRMRADRNAPAAPRSAERKDHDRRTAVIWVIVLVVLVCGLVGVYGLLNLPS